MTDVVGSLNADVILGLARLPDPGETVLGCALEHRTGAQAPASAWNSAASMTENSGPSRRTIPWTRAGRPPRSGFSDSDFQESSMGTACPSFTAPPRTDREVRRPGNAARCLHLQ